jgi:hypothetical protein
MAKPGVLPSDCIPDKCGVILCIVSGERVRFLETDTLTKSAIMAGIIAKWHTIPY